MPRECSVSQPEWLEESPGGKAEKVAFERNQWPDRIRHRGCPVYSAIWECRGPCLRRDPWCNEETFVSEKGPEEITKYFRSTHTKHTPGITKGGGYYFQMWKKHFLLEWDLCGIWQFGHDIHCDFSFPSFIPQAPNCYALWNTLNSWPCALLTPCQQHVNSFSLIFQHIFSRQYFTLVHELQTFQKLEKSHKEGTWPLILGITLPLSSSSCCTYTYCLIIFNKKTQNVSQFRT